MPAANWYPDPKDPNLARYWDGNAWTNQTRPKSELARPQQPTQQPVQSAQAARPEPDNYAPQSQPQQTAVVERPNNYRDFEDDDLPAQTVAPLPAVTANYDEAAYTPYSAEPTAPAPQQTYGVAEEVGNIELIHEDGYSQQLSVDMSKPYTLKELKVMRKKREVNAKEYKVLRKAALKRQSNTRFTSLGGFAFTLYLLAYPAVIGAAVAGAFFFATDVWNDITALNWSAQNIPYLVSELSAIAEGVAAQYINFRISFIVAVAASAGIPFLVGLIGAFKKKGRVWAVATLLLSLVFNPAILCFGALTNLSWWVILFG